MKLWHRRQPAAFEVADG